MNKRLLPKTSSHLNDFFICKYKIKTHNPLKMSVSGYKLVLDKGENFYSVSTGAYRYKTGIVSESGYSKLYQNTDSYMEEMVGRIAIFKNFEDIERFFPGLYKNDSTCVLKVVLDKGIMEVVGENEYCSDIPMYIGSRIKSMSRV